MPRDGPEIINAWSNRAAIDRCTLLRMGTIVRRVFRDEAVQVLGRLECHATRGCRERKANRPRRVCSSHSQGVWLGLKATKAKKVTAAGDGVGGTHMVRQMVG